MVAILNSNRLICFEHIILFWETNHRERKVIRHCTIIYSACLFYTCTSIKHKMAANRDLKCIYGGLCYSVILRVFRPLQKLLALSQLKRGFAKRSKSSVKAF